MKKLTLLFTVVLAAAAVLSFSGCSARSAVTADQFKKQAESLGYKVTEGTASSADIQKSLSAEKSESGSQVVYYSFASDAAAEDAYISVKKNITAGGTKGKSLDTATYTKYTLVNGELSYTLTRMNATLVFGKTTTVHQDEVTALFDALKY